jgi:hypothetical protein
MRTRAILLEPDNWYADCRDGRYTSFLRFVGHTQDKKKLFFEKEMKGFQSAYSPDHTGFLSWSSENNDWFIPKKEDVELWDLR